LTPVGRGQGSCTCKARFAKRSSIYGAPLHRQWRKPRGGFIFFFFLSTCAPSNDNGVLVGAAQSQTLGAHRSQHGLNGRRAALSAQLAHKACIGQRQSLISCVPMVLIGKSYESAIFQGWLPGRGGQMHRRCANLDGFPRNTEEYVTRGVQLLQAAIQQGGYKHAQREPSMDWHFRPSTSTTAVLNAAAREGAIIMLDGRDGWHRPRSRSGAKHRVCHSVSKRARSYCHLCAGRWRRNQIPCLSSGQA